MHLLDCLFHGVPGYLPRRRTTGMRQAFTFKNKLKNLGAHRLRLSCCDWGQVKISTVRPWVQHNPTIRCTVSLRLSLEDDHQEHEQEGVTSTAAKHAQQATPKSAHPQLMAALWHFQPHAFGVTHVRAWIRIRFIIDASMKVGRTAAVSVEALDGIPAKPSALEGLIIQGQGQPALCSRWKGLLEGLAESSTTSCCSTPPQCTYTLTTLYIPRPISLDCMNMR